MTLPSPSVADERYLRLNLGCGSCVVPAWTNVDYALGARLAKVPAFRKVNERLGLFHMRWDERIHIHDLRTRFPWRDGSAEAAYSSHTLEHLSRDEGRHFIKECHRVLAPGGVLRVIVPEFAVEDARTNPRVRRSGPVLRAAVPD